MKLYSKVKSEKATAETGGDDFLEIKVLNENKKEIAFMYVQMKENEIYLELSVKSKIGKGGYETYSIPLPKILK